MSVKEEPCPGFGLRSFCRYLESRKLREELCFALNGGSKDESSCNAVCKPGGQHTRHGLWMIRGTRIDTVEQSYLISFISAGCHQHHTVGEKRDKKKCKLIEEPVFLLFICRHPLRRPFSLSYLPSSPLPGRINMFCES